MRVQISAALLSWRRTNPDGQASAANMAPARAQNCKGAGRGGRGSPPGAGAGQVCPRVLCKSTTSALPGVGLGGGGLEEGGKNLYCAEWNRIPPTLCTPLSFSLLYHSNEGQSSN